MRCKRLSKKQKYKFIGYLARNNLCHLAGTNFTNPEDLFARTLQASKLKFKVFFVSDIYSFKFHLYKR